MLGRASGVLALVALSGFASPLRAQTATPDPTAPQTVAPDQPAAPASEPTPTTKKPLPWHGSSAIWVQRVTTQTLGVGPKPLSSDPLYDWLVYLRPRYSFWEDDRSSLSLRAQFEADYEFTNSDTTTEKNELLLADTIVALTPEHAFVSHGEYLTLLSLSLPRVVLPTSKASYDAGNIANVGVRAFLLQDFPLRENESWFPRGRVAFRAGYSYQFARDVVPELSTLNQVRMDLSGHSVSNDQVSGAALAEHAFMIHGLAGVDVWRNVIGVDAEFGVDPVIKFPLEKGLCVATLTGCATIADVNDPQRYGVITLFDAYVEARALGNAFHVAVGYENVTNQLAPESVYRSPLWSPDAHFYLRLDFVPDLLLEPPPPAAPRAGPAPGRNVASAR
ncbi:MAG TPA: hypothetical protein VMI54_31100 [Polyangiaceae bacterium]|nr:hypothetical protein [Polyangiaceae bacterium]